MPLLGTWKQWWWHHHCWIYYYYYLQWYHLHHHREVHICESIFTIKRRRLNSAIFGGYQYLHFGSFGKLHLLWYFSIVMWMLNAKKFNITFVTTIVYVSATFPTIALLGFLGFTQNIIDFLLQNTMTKHLAHGFFHRSQGPIVRNKKDRGTRVEGQHFIAQEVVVYHCTTIGLNEETRP